MAQWKRVVWSSCIIMVVSSAVALCGCMSNCQDTCGDISGWQLASEGTCTVYRPSSCPWFMEWCALPNPGYDDCINVCKMRE